MSFQKRSLYVLALFLPLMPHVAVGQSITDGVRLSSETLPSGSRSEAMGGLLISAADGYSALDANPAALAPIESKEFGLSLLDRNHNSTALFLGSTTQSSASNMALSSIGLAYPFKTVQGHFAVAVSYDRVRDYNSTYSFKAINPTSSFLNTSEFIQDPGSPVGATGNNDWFSLHNLAYALHLTDAIPDTGVTKFTTPYVSGLQQSGTITQESSLDAVRVGAGVDIAEGVSVGGTLNLFFGSYDYAKNYNETDVNGVYSAHNFTTANIVDAIHEDESGGSLKLGLLVNKFDAVSFGLTVETPQVIHVARTFDRSGTSQFGNTALYTSADASELRGLMDEYNVVSPVRLGAGASVHLLGATASASVSYADMSQLRFSNSDVDLTDLNQEARTELRSVLSWHLGAEYVIPILGLSIRAGYAAEPSPFIGDPASFDTKAISAGLGLLLSKSVLLEASIRHSTYHTIHQIYDSATPDGTRVSAGIDDDAVKRDEVTVSFNYRY